MSSKPVDMIHLVDSDNTLTAADLAKEIYGTSDAAASLLNYNSIEIESNTRLPAGAQLKLPSTLSGFTSKPKNGIIEIKLYTMQPRILDLQWKTKEIVTSDGSNATEMFAEIIGKTLLCKDGSSATLEIYQYSQDKKHILIDSNPTLKIVNNQLCGANGKIFKFWFEWHKTMYDWGKHFYFCKLIVENYEYEMQKTNESMLRLIHYNYLVNNPAGDFKSSVANECNTVKDYIARNGRFYDFLLGREKPTKQFVKMDDGGNGTLITKNNYKDFLNKGIVYHHYISSHGIAICQCDGNENWVEEFPNNTTSDGVVDWLCPVCKSKSKAMGAFCLANSELFKVSDASTLLFVPKLLIIASCCLTAITDIFPQIWISKGTRWYIGWGVPVPFSNANSFAKKFYSTWCNKYNMNPDKIKDTFDSVQSNYWKWRPRLFGK